MNYKTLVQYIKYISEKHSLVNSALEGDNIYEMNHKDIVYPIVYLTPQQHIIDNPISTYKFVIFFVDRLLDDKSNKLDIQTSGLKALNDIMLDIDGLYETESDKPFNATLFTERFSDETAGVFFEISIQSYNENNECTSLSNDSVLVYSELNGPLITENNLDIILD